MRHCLYFAFLLIPRYAEKCFFAAFVISSYVQSLEGAEEISAVTYGMTLPEPYLSEMNAKLAVAQAQMNAITEKLGN